MTIIISIAGILGRAIGDVLTSSLGWASSLLFGRVPRSHQVLVTMMLAGSLLWILLVAAVLLPALGAALRASTPVASSAGVTAVQLLAILALVLVPAGIGLAGYLAPKREDRAQGLAAVGQILRGYPLAVVMGAMFLFLPAVGLDRKVRSMRRGWSDAHVPIVVKPGGYERMVSDLQAALAAAGLRLTIEEAPGILSVPGRTLALIGDRNVSGLVPDRLVELHAPGLEIGVYPSDIAVAGATHERLLARAVVVSRLATTSAHFTTSAESQAVEDRLAELMKKGGTIEADLDEIDRLLLELDVAPEEWDILYRLRLQAERDALRR